MADPPKTRPGRPDQRVHLRRLTPGSSAGHLPNPISERDRCPHSMGARWSWCASSALPPDGDLAGIAMALDTAWPPALPGAWSRWVVSGRPGTSRLAWPADD